MTYLKPVSYKVTGIFLKHAKSWNSNFWCESDDFKFPVSFTGVTQVGWYLLFQDGFQTAQCKWRKKKKIKLLGSFHSLSQAVLVPLVLPLSLSFPFNSFHPNPTISNPVFPALNPTFLTFKKCHGFFSFLTLKNLGSGLIACSLISFLGQLFLFP